MPAHARPAALRFRLADEQIAVRREAAAQPFPTELGVLDAIHLATATVWREQAGTELVMATHDVALATAARASGLPVVGVP